VNRRTFAKTLFLTAGALALGGHTPYGQWVVYRKKHLLIGCHKADPETYDLAKAAVAVLAEHLPAASARVARAPDARRLASLIGTGQMEVAILSPGDAAAMSVGQGRFEPYGEIPLGIIAPVGARLLVAHGDFPARHAWLLSRSLLGTIPSEGGRQAVALSVGWHPGAQAYLSGDPEPAYRQ